MTSRRSSLSGIKNALRATTLLEFAVHLLDLGYFNPVVFSHDNLWFDRRRYSQVMIGFLNLLSFLDSCGVLVETDLLEPSEVETEVYRRIMRDEDQVIIIRCYELHEMDFTGLNIENAVIPENCEDIDFALVKIYLLLKTGAALNKKAVEAVFNQKLTDTEMLTVRRQLAAITGRDIVKRNDNSYEMR